ncbi:MAG: TonB C-terminal domain-containing protein [Rhodocyclaceae bacterium]|nr:TonB C-terminal domain-containing protein [Rhodocyclaceae bacterium]
MKTSPPRSPGKRMAFFLALLVHLVLLIFLFYGIEWQRKEAVVAVDLVPAPQKAATTSDEPVAKAPAATPPPKPLEPKPAPEAPPPKPEILQKEKTRAAPKPPAPLSDPFKEQLERELKEAEKRKAQEAAARELAELSARESALREASAREQYIAAIRAKIRGNIVMPPALKGNPEAVFEVTQLPSGEVLSTRLVKSSGQPAWDLATERAILKSSPLPKPAQPQLFARVLELRFRPLEE